MTEQIKAGMKFGTFGEAFSKVTKEENKRPKFVGRNNPNFKSIYLDNNNGNSISYQSLKKPDAKGNHSHLRATMQGLLYGADSQNFYDYTKIDDLDKISKTRFTKIVDHKNGKYAEDKNGNGVVDKNEIFDINW